MATPGKSVRKAVENVSSRIAPTLAGRDVRDQRGTDAVMSELDATPNTSNLHRSSRISSMRGRSRRLLAVAITVMPGPHTFTIRNLRKEP